MRVSASYNAEADTAYLRFGEPRPVARSIVPLDDLVLDLDADGRLVGVEFVTASRLLDEGSLRGIEQDELLGTTQIAALLGKAKQNVAQHYTRRADFPSPAAELPTGRYWRRADVERWMREKAVDSHDTQAAEEPHAEDHPLRPDLSGQ